jgi:hypothetical protein
VLDASRRGLLAGATALFGAELCAPLARALAAEAQPGFVASHACFSTDQRALVTAIAERIIPATDTPGATAAGVPAFIELMLADWYETEARNQFLDGIGRVDGHAQVRFNHAFAALTPYEQDEILTAAMNNQIGQMPTGFFAQCRQLVILGYYTSEIGCKQERIYVPVPGRYDGRFPYAGKVYSS